MASITSLMGSTNSTSGIYGNRNVISGLASGLDTESMIENAVSGIKERLKNLNRDRTMLEWEQSAYRSIIDKMVSFSSKYTSYSSSTNLMSNSFFDSATRVTTGGTYANLVSATGKSSSDFKILSATAATAATYSGIGTFDIADGKTFGTGLTMAELGLTAEKLGLAEGKNLNLSVTLEDGTEKSFEIAETDTLGSVLSKMKSELGINATYSEITGEFYLKSTETGKANSFTLGGSLATALFGANATQKAEGTDATVKLSINGTTVEKTQAGNIFNIDGMQVTLKGNIAETSEADAVSFTTSVDSDKIISTIKSMVEEYNTMANEIHTAYTTKPLTTSKGKRYEPLTEEEASELSESTIENYEKKAKTGILFGDNDLFSAYDEMRSIISSMDLEAIGITTVYDGGKTTLSVDETKLRSALENDPDKVRDTFTADKTSGAQKDGVMTRFQKTMDKYAKTTGDKGILVNLAGTEKSATSLTNNNYKSRIDRLQEQIERWEEKLSNKIDYYTKQFSALEQMISDMNSQSSALMGMMGY